MSVYIYFFPFDREGHISGAHICREILVKTVMLILIQLNFVVCSNKWVCRFEQVIMKLSLQSFYKNKIITEKNVENFAL